jgi:DNA polymerase-1
MGVAKLARRIKTTIAEAKEKRELYLSTYPAVSSFYNSAKEETRLTGYSYTVLGRRRALSGINSSQGDLRNECERKAINSRIQGSAADVVKMAQINCYRAGLENRYGCEMLLQIHDELVFQCPKETAKEAQTEIVAWMEHPFPTDLAVPLSVDAGMGSSWAEGH